MSKKAFTLIELLIVVAIIAILAAIAVPNFLEAQVRSKVSRCKADMRTCGIGIEMYQVDHNIMPYADAANGTAEYLRWIDSTNDQNLGCGWKLTTPVAYMTSIPWDVFNSTKGGHQAPHNVAVNVKMASFLYRTTNKSRSVWIAYPRTEDAALVGYPDGLTTCDWSLASTGPDLLPWPQDHPNATTYSGANNIYVGMLYDPSNGTVSAGDIMYFCGWGFRQ